MQAKALFLSEGHTATTDYFIVPYLESRGYEVSLLDSRFFSTYFDSKHYQLFVISRYLTDKQLSFLEKNTPSQLKIVYFMDDDLFDFHVLRGLPWLYQWKIFTKAIRHRMRLQKLCDEIWVSTPYLAEKYAHLQPKLLSPMLSGKTRENKAAVQVCYHGTASHQQEIDWLLPIISAVQSRTENIHFELFGSRKVAKTFRQLPRVSVLHQMSWTHYLAFTSMQKRDIALAPLLNNRFNAARGATKFYDYARMNAVGIYSNVQPYQGFIQDDVDGFLLDNQPEKWIEKIVDLANDVQKRQQMIQAIQNRCTSLTLPNL
jgi:hypothetical protein